MNNTHIIYKLIYYQTKCAARFASSTGSAVLCYKCCYLLTIPFSKISLWIKLAVQGTECVCQESVSGIIYRTPLR